jgi:hypothetical protein
MSASVQDKMCHPAAESLVCNQYPLLLCSQARVSYRLTTLLQVATLEVTVLPLVSCHLAYLSGPL